MKILNVVMDALAGTIGLFLQAQVGRHPCLRAADRPAQRPARPGRSARLSPSGRLRTGGVGIRLPRQTDFFIAILY